VRLTNSHVYRVILRIVDVYSRCRSARVVDAFSDHTVLVMNINYPSVMPEVCFIHIEVSCMMFHSSVFFDSSAAVKKAAHKANPLGACDSAT